MEEKIGQWSAVYNEIVAEWQAQCNAHSPNHSTIAFLRFQANTLWRTTVIEELAGRSLLPRYGFPIGVLSLISPGSGHHGKPAEPVQLERSGLLALAEYVPGSVVLAGGRYYESHGLVRSFGKGNESFGARARKWLCPHGHVNYTFSPGPAHCSESGCLAVLQGTARTLLFVRHGFSTAAWDPPAWHGKAERVGSVALGTTSFVTRKVETLPSFGGHLFIDALLCEDGEILVDNAGEHGHGFAICTRCGYAASETHGHKAGTVKLPSGFDSHIPLHQQSGPCLTKGDPAAPLRNTHLAAKQVTDLLRLDVRNAPASTAMALGYAVVISAADLLELDQRELGVFFDGSRITIFETAAGGCGHMAELAMLGERLLEKAQRRLRGSPEHDRICTSGCLSCILTPRSQRDIELGIPDRAGALRFLVHAGGSSQAGISSDGPLGLAGATG